MDIAQAGKKMERRRERERGKIERVRLRKRQRDRLCLSSAVLVKSPVERWTCSAD